MCFVATASRLTDFPKLKISDYKAYLRTQAQVTLNYSYGGNIYSQTLKTTTTPCNYGAYRYWWLCPACGRRVSVLYCNNGFACRHCIGASYESQLAYPIIRPLLQIESIDKRLYWDKGLLANPTKPKAMHQSTYIKIMQKRNNIIQQVIGELAMLDKTKAKPKKQPHEYTLDDIFAELDHAKFMAGAKGNTYVLAIIPVIKAKLLDWIRVGLVLLLEKISQTIIYKNLHSLIYS